MIFYRLTDEQARRAITALLIAVPWVAFIALQLAGRGRVGTAEGFAALLLVLFGLIGLQVVQSRRLNAADRELAGG